MFWKSKYDTFNKTHFQTEFQVLYTTTSVLNNRLLLFVIALDGAPESPIFSSLGLSITV